MQAAEKKAFAGIMGAFSVLTGYGAWWQFRKHQLSAGRFNKIQENLNQFEPFELKGLDSKFYPWYRDSNTSNWEYRLVKLRGYFKEERFFVAREKDGKDGFLVFAPFVTAVQDPEPQKRNDANPVVEHQVFINLGWVPSESKGDIKMGNEPIPNLEAPENNDLSEEERYTGFLLDPNSMQEEKVISVTEVTGIVRLGEESSLVGKKNFINDGVYNYIDLDHWAKFFRVFNRDACSSAYIERVVPELDEESFPVPTTKTGISLSNNYLQNGTLLGGVSAISIASILLYSLK